MKRKTITLLVAIAFITSSCATIFTGSKTTVILDSNLEKADAVTVDGRKYKNVTFPFTTKVKKGFNESTQNG